MEEIQQLFNSLMQQMEDNFQQRLQILNKRYHVMESNLKSKIKHLEQKPIKKDDMEIAKLKAKIFSLEHQLENFQPHMQKEPQNISQSEVLQNMIDNLQINIIELYPQIDNIMPNLIELLPIQTSLLIDLTLLLYKNKFYSNFKLDQQILDKRRLTESLEQQVNDVMLASGQAKTYEISFNPRTEYWKKKLKLKSQEIEKKTYSLRLIQSQKVQDHIIKLMKTHLEETFFKINRDNPKFNYQQIPIYVQRINSILMLLMLSDNEQDFLIAIKNLTFDLNSKSTIVQRYLSVQINQRQIDQLLFLRILDFEKSIEILFNSLQLMQAMKSINIEKQLFYSFIANILWRQGSLQVFIMKKSLINCTKVYNDFIIKLTNMIRVVKEDDYQEDTIKKYTIYQQKRPKKQQQGPPKSLPLKQLFNFLNVWDCELEKKKSYIQKFQQYRDQKKEDIEYEELQKKMQKPDFIRFFKYLKKQQESDQDDTENEDSVKIAYTAQARRDLNKKSKHKFPKIEESRPKLPSSFDPKLQIPQPDPNDFLIVSHFYKQAIEFEDQKQVSKDLIATYLLQNKKFCEAYNINKYLVEEQLKEYPTAQLEFITLDEFLNFVLYPKLIIIKSNQGLPNQVEYEQNPKIIITEENLRLLKDIYDQLNIDGQFQVNISKLATFIRTQYEGQKILFVDLLSYEGLKKVTCLEKFLYEFEIDAIQNNKLSTSWDHIIESFQKQFKIPHKGLVMESEQMGQQYQTIKKHQRLYSDDYSILPIKVFAQLEKIFLNTSSLKFAPTHKLISNIIGNDEFMLRNRKRLVRKEETTQLKVETIEQTLERIEQEADEFIDLDELIDFFTVRGRPLPLSQKIKKQIQKKEEKTKEGDLTIRRPYSPEVLLITIPNNIKEESPKPKSIRQKQIEKMLNKQERDIQEELNYKFKANSVPWYVTEPLYDQILREKEENRQRLKEESVANLMSQMMQPKSFEKQKKEIKQPEEHKFKFKARPPPDEVLNPMYDDMVAERKLKSKQSVERRKQEWEQHFLETQEDNQTELRMEELRLKYSKKNPNSYQPDNKFDPITPKEMPDFRYLHEKFQDELAQKKKQFEPTVPIQNGLSKTNIEPILQPEPPIVSAQEKMQAIDDRLNKILSKEPPTLLQNKATKSLSAYKRKLKADKLIKLQVENAEVQKMKEERQKLLPKGIIAVNQAAIGQEVLDQELDELVKWKQKFHKNLDKDYDKQLQKMAKRVRKRPLLMYQRDTDDDSESDQDNKNDNNGEEYF